MDLDGKNGVETSHAALHILQKSPYLLHMLRSANQKCDFIVFDRLQFSAYLFLRTKWWSKIQMHRVIFKIDGAGEVEFPSKRKFIWIMHIWTSAFKTFQLEFYIYSSARKPSLWTKKNSMAVFGLLAGFNIAVSVKAISCL